MERKVITLLADKIRDEYRPEKIILFGSYAWGRPDAESDIDLLIVKNSKKPFHKRWSEVCKIVSKEREKIAFSPFVVTPGELEKKLSENDPFFVKILKEGKVLYG
jgi:uncharacterized protein